MFTQCSQCETVFKLSAEVLRAAGGQVRCGKCGEVFNALAHLAEDASAFATGESAFDLETRADSILESVPRPPMPPHEGVAPRGGFVAEVPDEGIEEFAPPGVEIARLQILDWSEGELPGAQRRRGADDAARIADDQERRDAEQRGDDEAGKFEASLEFTLPPGELDRVFVEFAANRPPAGRPGAAQKAAERPPQRRIEPAPEPASQPEDVEIFDATDRNVEPVGLQVSEAARREMLSGLQPQAPAMHRALGRAHGMRPSVPWLGAVIAAALLLVAQVVHQNREWLAAHAPFGGALRALYAALGAPIPKPENLAAYQLRQWGVTGDPAADGTLRVRASILNAASEPEPFPLLRVTLANRFGGSVGARDFEPTEYVGKRLSGSMVPGERVDATMNILDPGKSAEGFEIDVCLRGVNGTVTCANDAGAAAKK